MKKTYKPKRLHKYLEGAPEYICAIYVNEKFTVDKYSVFFNEGYENGKSLYLGCGDGGVTCCWGDAYRGIRCGKLIHWKDLDEKTRSAIIQRYEHEEEMGKKE